MYATRNMLKKFRCMLGRLRGNIIVDENRLGVSPVPAALRLGDIMIAAGEITREQLNNTLEQQKYSGKKIGELLVECGFVQQNQVDHGLRMQQLLVSAALGTALALHPAVEAEAGGSAASINATATVKSIARINVLHQLSQIVITDENINQGYLEVSAASHVEVKNSSLSGYMISMEVPEGPFQHVLVRGLGTELQISFGCGWLLKPYSRIPEVLELTYRFILSADAKPGTYSWPVQISVAAI